jgi:hypothetical protein
MSQEATEESDVKRALAAAQPPLGLSNKPFFADEKEKAKAEQQLEEHEAEETPANEKPKVREVRLSVAARLGEVVLQKRGGQGRGPLEDEEEYGGEFVLSAAVRPHVFSAPPVEDQLLQVSRT